MEMLLQLTVLTVIFPLFLLSPISSGSGNEQEVSDDVKELENLRNLKNPVKTASESKTLSTMSSLTAQLPSTETPVSSGSSIFRHRGMEKTKKNAERKENAEPLTGGFPKYGGLQYSPKELATYVFQTGDEEGVAVAVDEMVREGLMTRMDAILYLQRVKQILMYLREQFDLPKRFEELRNEAYSKLEPSETHQLPAVETTVPAEPKPSITHTKPETSPSNEERTKRISYKEPEDFMLEVIYKVSRDVFTESILRDSPMAVSSLNGLVSFLENEVGKKRIPPEIKEKVLKVVSVALMDSLREYQRFSSISDFYQNLNESGSDVPMPKVFRKLSQEGQETGMQSSTTNEKKNSSS